MCLRGVCVNTGNLGMSLVWSRPGDGDIYLTTPGNRTIYYGNRGPSVITDGGFLDMDDQNGTGPENIYWPTNSTTPPVGTYYICWQTLTFSPSISVSNPLILTATVRVPLQPTQTFTIIVTRGARTSIPCRATSATLLGTFTYP